VVVFPATVLVWMNCFLPETGVAKLRLSTHPVSVERNQDLLFLLEISASIFAGCRTPVYIPDGRLENVFRLVSMVVLLPIHWEAVQSICLDGGAFLFFLSHIILLSHARLRFYIRSTPGLVVTKYFGRSKLVVFYQAFTRSFRSYFFFCYRRLLNPRMESWMHKGPATSVFHVHSCCHDDGPTFLFSS